MASFHMLHTFILHLLYCITITCELLHRAVARHTLKLNDYSVTVLFSLLIIY